jgi:hypothetical protein
VGRDSVLLVAQEVDCDRMEGRSGGRLGVRTACPVFQIDEDRTNWRIAVPNWELMDLGGRESTRLFFTFILQMLSACQESKEGAYAGAFGVFRRCWGIVSSVHAGNCFICGR